MPNYPTGFNNTYVSIYGRPGPSLVDVSGHVSPMDTYQFCVTSGSGDCLINGEFINLDGYAAADPYRNNASIPAFSGALYNGTVYKWVDFYNTVQNTGSSMLPSTVVGIRFDHDMNISYICPPVTSGKLNISLVKNGATWEDIKNRVVGRSG
jgi:hypothetical protein